jgi:hypothetical protein
MPQRTTPLYVQPLNKAQEGPYTLTQALISAKGHHYISDREIERMKSDYEEGGTGPWHFSYGFISTTITVGAMATGGTTAPAKASTLEVMDAYETTRGIVYELARAIGPERALRQLKLLLADTTQGAPDTGMADAAIWEIARIVEFDTRENVSAEASLEAIQETIASYDVEMRFVAKRAA